MKKDTTKTLLYCPLLDGHIMQEIRNLAKELFEDGITDFVKTYGRVELRGKTEFQKLICTLPVVPIQDSDILHFSKVVADKEREQLLIDFWEKEKMQLTRPEIPDDMPLQKCYVIAAVMVLKAHWCEEYAAEKKDYPILPEESATGEELSIKGYRLDNVELAMNEEGKVVSACIRLDDDITIRLSDVTAFGDKDIEIPDVMTLYTLVQNHSLDYRVSGYLIAPCIDEEVKVKDHLTGIGWNDPCGDGYGVEVTRSQALVQLKLNEEGVEARAETVAEVCFTFGDCDDTPHYGLKIAHGLIIDIRRGEESLIVGYVPQHRFITTQK